MSRRVQNVELDISNDHVVLYSICLLLLTIQLAVSCGSYSGKNKPKMFGDFEAQRHWMEITFNLPINLWYVNDTNNDLNYWGLDYPPLTAYHSYIMGVISNYMDPSWVALESSRGIETESHKLFMRISVLITFWIIYIPPIIAYIEFFSFYKPKNLYFMIAILYPGIISLDNGHFQYNHISLGIFLISFICLISRYFTLSSILFVLAFNYKQMELYHSLPIAVFLLSTALQKPYSHYSLFQSFCHLFKLFVAVVLTFSVLWFPFFYHGVAFDVLKRIFPFYRGLFEDKVANFWCTFSVLIKFKSLFSIEYLLKLSTVVVLLVVLPSLLILFAQPTSVNFKISLFISSLAFFLFSFQVHEKSILIAAVPALLLWHERPIAISWFLIISNASLFPLCVQDGNSLHLALFVSFYVLASSPFSSLHSYQHWLLHLDCLVSFILCFSCICFPVPAKYPHIYSLSIAIYSFFHFFLFFIYFNYLMFSNALMKFYKRS